MSFVPSPINPTSDTAKPSPFIAFTQRVIPATFDESMSYQEALYALLKYIKDLQETVNNNAQITVEQTKVIDEMTDYINNYFDNLDVQEEINNKLDDMAESGELENIIAAYLNTTAIFGYDNITALKTATNITNEGYAVTYGFYQLNDGGGAKYKIREITNADVVDEKFIISLADENLIAELIIENSELNMLSIGAKHEDNTFDNTSILLAAIAKANESKLIT